jgi:UTP--glucose-1-phosphate uridylyltransferase
MANIVYVRQPYPKWDWDAILRTKNLIWNEPFLVLFWDDLIDNEVSAARQLVDAYEKTNSSVICSFQVPEERMWSYGILESSSTEDIFKVDKFMEKPKAEATKSRNGNIWKYVLTPDIFDYLEKSESLHSDWETRLIDAFEAMRKDKNVYWVRIKWTRHDTWSKIW